jgi:hypothetical protein
MYIKYTNIQPPVLMPRKKLGHHHFQLPARKFKYVKSTETNEVMIMSCCRLIKLKMKAPTMYDLHTEVNTKWNSDMIVVKITSEPTPVEKPRFKYQGC